MDHSKYCTEKQKRQLHADLFSVHDELVLTFDRPSSTVKPSVVLVEEVEDVDRVNVGRNRPQRSSPLLGQVVFSGKDNRDGQLGVVDVLEGGDQVDRELELWRWRAEGS